MLTISEVAAKFKISNRQVHDMVNYGYLNVANVYRRGNYGISYLFSENELNRLDIYSILAEIQEKKKQHIYYRGNPLKFRNLINALNYYERFLANIEYHPEREVLQTAFYLFHLNHYAKTYKEQSNELYSLKNNVLKKMYQENSPIINTCYLIGPDRKKIFLCEDCKDSARSARMSFVEYVKKGYYCPKCYIQSIEKEYYSLLEFKIDAADYRFTFHLPRSSAIRWMGEIDNLPQGNRQANRYDDKMYLYGRPVSRTEERVFPLPVVKEFLCKYLDL
jgi:hypothetical protein